MATKYTKLIRYQKGIGKPCAYCERSMDPTSPLLMPTRDHIEPASKGGRQVVWACADCNNRKTDLTYAQWQAFMAAHPQWWNTPLRPVRPDRMRPANPKGLRRILLERRSPYTERDFLAKFGADALARAKAIGMYPVPQTVSIGPCPIFSSQWVREPSGQPVTNPQ